MPRGRPTKRVALARQQLASYTRGMVDASGLNSSKGNYNFPCTSTTGIIEDILKCTQCLESTRKHPVFQCEGGHILCTDCYPRVQICPICHKELNIRIRSLVAEMLISRLMPMPKIENNEPRSSFENVTQKVVWVEEKDKRHCLVDILDAAGLRQRNRSKAGSTLIFVEEGDNAFEMDDFLYQQGFLVTSWFEEKKTLQQNEESLELFRSGVRRIMVATESLAPRIDFTTVHHVINYDLPSHFEEYMLRITCTGKLGKLGLVTSFFNDKNWNLSKNLKDLISKSKQEYPGWLETVNIDVNNGDNTTE